jgi:P-type E1-E2 ATPase
MMWDLKMMATRTPSALSLPGTPDVDLPMKVNNSGLNQDLGYIEYVFSDKTGTLTQNDMKLAKWYINGAELDELKNPGIFSTSAKVCITLCNLMLYKHINN